MHPVALDWIRAVGRLALALVLLGTALAIAVFVVSRPMIAAAVYRFSVSPAHRETAGSIIEWVVEGRGGGPLPLNWLAGTMTLKEAKHYSDVRRRLRWNCWFAWTGFSLVLLARCSEPWAQWMCEALRSALRLFLWLALLSAVWASLDWRSYFYTVHSAFFPEGSWRFPSGSVSVQVFPGRYWQAMLGLVVIGATGLLGLGQTLFRIPVQTLKTTD